MSFFTPAMRARQAKGSDPYAPSPPDTDGADSAERRDFAASVLASSELLLMYALSTSTSLTRTRLHFTHMLAGFSDAPGLAPPKAARYRARDDTGRTEKMVRTVVQTIEQEDEGEMEID